MTKTEASISKSSQGGEFARKVDYRLRSTDDEGLPVRSYGAHQVAKAEIPAKSSTSLRRVPTEPYRCEDFVNVRSYAAPNWWTSEGVMKKRRLIEAKGLPDFKGWKFVTLTLDPEKFESVLQGYLKGKNKVRAFLSRLRREGLIEKGCKWCWKLEFQRNGWPHWHLLIEHLPKWSVEEMGDISEAWGYGRVNIEAVRDDSFLYSFKYAFKPVIQESEEDMFPESVSYALPGWFLDYFEVPAAGGKPKTFARVRFWQTSRGFYTGGKAAEKETPKEAQSSLVPFPARVALERSEDSVQVIGRDRQGGYKKSAVVRVASISALWIACCWATLEGNGVGLTFKSFVIPAKIVETQEQWQIKKMQRANRLTPLRAERLRGINWRTY